MVICSENAQFFITEVIWSDVAYLGRPDSTTESSERAAFDGGVGDIGVQDSAACSS